MKAWPLIAALAVPLVGLLVSCGGDSPSSKEPARTTPSRTATATPTSGIAAALENLDLPLDLASGLSLGKQDAPVTIAVFEDFQCPHCLRYTALIEPAIIDEYVTPGRVRLEFHNLSFLGPESVQAALAAWCAGEQDQFWPYHKQLFLVQAEAGQATSEKLDVGRFSDTALRQYAADLGLDTAAFEACYSSTAAAEGVRADLRQAQSLGLRGTPSFVINGQPLATSPSSLAEWRKFLDQALAK